MAKSARKSASKTVSKTPWAKSNPRKTAGQSPKSKSSRKLAPAKKAAARKRAKKAGRRYPNLVDNMWASSKTRAKPTKSSKKKASKKSTAKKSTRKRVAKTPKKAARKTAASAKKSARKTKDPRGGLTAAGRAALRKRDGSHLKPGVTKKTAEMSLQEMRRKGSWAVRFYGRAKLPPLVDKNGAPTRHALSAHAWGEPVPMTEAAARRIAEKGHRLLDRYHRLQDEDFGARAKSSRSKVMRKRGRAKRRMAA